ncbi:helix-turn-helix transcriptional regulator [Sphingomonas sp. TX0543]|uniref:helix-turn-helix transcriptional regulator n=1 Tax=Sphingomonas sp. TX0543 TaxID=3399682 RepID=UPI003AFB22C9
MPTHDPSSLIDLIHDTPFNPTLWVEVIERLNDEIGADSAVMTKLDIVSHGGIGLPIRQDTAVWDEYIEQWSTRNPLHMVEDPIAYIANWKPTILRDGEWLDRDVLRATPYFNEFLRPIRAEHSMMIRLGLDDTVVSNLSLARREARGAFQSSEVARARRYQTHIMQALRTARRLKIDQAALDQLDILLASTDQALIFLDRDLRVRRMTAAAERRLFDSGILRLVNDRLAIPDDAQNARLQSLLQAAALAQDSGAPIFLSPVPGAVSIGLRTIPLGPRSMAAHSSEPFVLLSAFDPVVEKAAPTRELDLRNRFRLTAAEARVAMAIADGLSIREVAERIDVSIHTVRAQLGTIFAKTGTHRQADLVRLLLGHRPGGA